MRCHGSRLSHQGCKLVEEETGYIDRLDKHSGVNGPNNKALYGAQNLEELQNVLLNEWDKWPVYNGGPMHCGGRDEHGISAALGQGQYAERVGKWKASTR